MTTTHFEPTWDSLQTYRCPDWFRDAKFGIWAHWGPQAVPEVGDWYARNMYIEDHPQYQHHLRFGLWTKSGIKTQMTDGSTRGTDGEKGRGTN